MKTNSNKGMGLIVGVSVILVGTAAYFIIKGLQNSKVKPKDKNNDVVIDNGTSKDSTTTENNPQLFGGVFGSIGSGVKDIFSKYGLTPYKPIDVNTNFKLSDIGVNAPSESKPLSDLGVTVNPVGGVTPYNGTTPTTKYGSLFGF